MVTKNKSWYFLLVPIPMKKKTLYSLNLQRTLFFTDALDVGEADVDAETSSSTTKDES